MRKIDRARLDKGSPFGHAMEAAEEAGLIVRASEIEANIWTATEGERGWGEVCRFLAAQLPGMMIPIGATGGAVWKCGSLPPGYILPTEELPGIREARAAAAECLPTMTVIKWSVGAIARQMLEWALKAQATEEYAEAIMEAEPGVDRESMYHDCIPGRYEYAAHWDLRSCFYVLMSRLPCLRVSLDCDGLHWGAYSYTERIRVGALLRAVEGSHRLRNSVWGVCLGSHKKGTAYTSSAPPPERKRKNGTVQVHADWEWWKPGMVRVIRTPPRLGPFRPAALLVARSASELCHLESLASGSVYSTVDCVTIPGKGVPQVWPQVGLPFRCKRQGRTVIVGRRVYRFGRYRSKPYEAVLAQPKERRHFTQRPVGKPEVPARLFFKEWL